MKKNNKTCLLSTQFFGRWRIRVKNWHFGSGAPVPRVIVYLFLSLIWISLPAGAQSASSTPPAKWPDQTECRALIEAGGQTEENVVLSGWCIAIDDRRGNCIACHTFNVSPWPVSLPIAGNLAPPMVAIRARFPDSTVLRKVIEDASSLNSHSSMPPYLKHRILTAKEIDQLIGFLGTL